MKLAVLQRTLRLGSKASASRARREICQRAQRLADTPYNQAQVLSSLITKCQPVLREHGFDGLVEILSEA